MVIASLTAAGRAGYLRCLSYDLDPLDYTDPVDEKSKLEAGYALELHRQDIRSDADSLDVVRAAFFQDPARTYRFRLDQVIHAGYGPWHGSLGKLSALGGLPPSRNGTCKSWLRAACRGWSCRPLPWWSRQRPIPLRQRA